MADSQSVLAQLVAPCSAGEFLTRHWPEKWFVAHGDATRLPACLRAPELAGVDELSKNYRGTVLFTAGRKTQYLYPTDQVKAISLYQMGLTVKFHDVGPSIGALPAALRQLEYELGINPGAITASVFASPTSEGLPVHFDAEDVFSIQLRGNKRFHVAPAEELRFPSGTQYAPGCETADELYPQVGEDFPDPRRADFTTVEMKPGSVLFLPRGTWHYTEAGGDSMSVSLALDVPSAAHHVLAQLRALLLQRPEWRRPLYGAWADGGAREAATAQAAQLLAELPELARQLKAEQLVTNILPMDRRLDLIKPKTQFRKAPSARVAFERAAIAGADEVMMIMVADSIAGEKVAANFGLPAAVAAAFRWIGEQAAVFSAEQLATRFAQLPFPEHQKILRAATEFGLVKMLWYQTLVDAPAKPRT